MKYIVLMILITSCALIPERRHKYLRKDWHHWSDEDKDCQNTRQEILIQRSSIPVRLNAKGCTVFSGRWDDFYYPEFLTRAKDVDIDHLIPLKHAHDVGGSNWTLAEKETFANDPQNLVTTSKKYNRAKGAKTIAQWLPVQRVYACQYIREWIRLKKKYELRLTKPELKTIETSKCLGP
jgi:hypothetical protein